MSSVAAELLVLRQEGEHLDSSWCVGSARNDVRVLAGLPPLWWSGVVGFSCCLTEGAQGGETRVSAGVPPQGLGPGGGRTAGRRGRQGSGHQRPDDLCLATAGPHRSGPGPRPDSAEKAELLAARRRIAQLETELAVARRAAELLKEGHATASGKPGSRLLGLGYVPEGGEGRAGTLSCAG